MKIPVKAGQRVKARLQSDIQNTRFAACQHPARLLNPYGPQILQRRLLKALLETLHKLPRRQPTQIGQMRRIQLDRIFRIQIGYGGE
ncbi:hypothetical protein HMPREF1548_01988, partial [Clostridium sp. KLE 1755]